MVTTRYIRICVPKYSKSYARRFGRDLYRLKERSIATDVTDPNFIFTVSKRVGSVRNNIPFLFQQWTSLWLILDKFKPGFVFYTLAYRFFKCHSRRSLYLFKYFVQFLLRLLHFALRSFFCVFRLFYWTLRKSKIDRHINRNCWIVTKFRFLNFLTAKQKKKRTIIT